MAFVFHARQVDIDTGGNSQVALLRGHDAETYGINPGDRLRLRQGHRIMHVVADITHHSIEHGEIGLFSDTWSKLRTKTRTPIIVEVLSRPASVAAISKKLRGQKITEPEMRSIIEDIVSRRLGAVETTYFVASGYVRPYREEELVWMVRSMAETGHLFRWRRSIVVDKHSIGGLAGNRTTLVAVPIIAASGLLIPKTSSRAITSPAGTADTMEVLAPVVHDPHRVRQIVEQTNGCLIWGGGLAIAPADDIIIRVSRPLSLEPYDKMIVSIMAKKVAMGVTHLCIDMPFGHGTKVPDRQTATHLTKRFQRMGRAFGMRVTTRLDAARQPVGNGIGPALEARDVLRVLQQTPDRPRDLEDKAVLLAAELMVLSRHVKSLVRGVELAKQSLRSRSAWRKMQSIIQAQGGNPDITPAETTRTAVTHTVYARRGGHIREINNRAVDEIARTLGAPDHKQAGIDLHRKLGQTYRKGDPLFTLYAPNTTRLTLGQTALKTTQIAH